MANDEHLAKLAESPEAWNEWTENRPSFKPELRDANLRTANLSWANLYDADLRRADLTYADLSCAHLHKADLRDADLTESDLHGADLHDANLSHANLTDTYLHGADLSGANLSRANLRGAHLHGANLSGANLSKADLRGAYLSEVIGLEEVRCNLPARIDAETVLRSGGFSEEFLRHIGTPEEAIRLYTMTATHSDHVEIVFKRDMWAQLFPIERALAVTLQSDDYSIEKHTDRIIIKLKSPDRFGDVLNAAIPMIAGLESVSPGEVESLTVSPVEGDDEVLKGDELVRVAEVVEPVALLEGPDSKELGFVRKTLVKAAEGVPIAGGVLGFWLETCLKNTDQIGTLYTRFKVFFAAAKGLDELDTDNEQPQLPRPDEEESENDDSR